MRMQSENRQYDRELINLPEGRLYQLKSGERTYYYHIIGNGKSRIRKGITGNKNLVKQLARKEYLLWALKIQTKTIDRINRISTLMDFGYWQTALSEVSHRFPSIPAEVFLLGNQYEPPTSRSASMFTAETIHRTQQGVKVRSKSELIIADMLEYQEIPYQYEVELPWDDYYLCPDFTVVRPRDSKVIYWEHFGKTNDDEYLRKMDLKIVKYRNMGIKPWDNLMISYDRENGSLDLGIIRSMIDSWLK